MKSIIKIIHKIIIFVNIIYIFVFRQKSRWDLLFIAYFFLLNIHWVLLNGECVMNYLYRKQIDSNYKLGDVFEYKKEFNIPMIFPLFIIIYLTIVYIVGIRNGLNPILMIILIISSHIYILIINYVKNKQVYNYYSIFHLVLFVTSLVYFMFQLIK